MAQEPGIKVGGRTLRKRRLVISANLLVQVIAALALCVMVNWLAWRHYARFDWTHASYYALAEKTKQVLAALPEPVDVVVFIPESSAAPYVEKVLQDTRNLLKEFQLFGRDNLRVEYVDPQRDLARAQQLVEQYKIDTPDVVIFASGPRHKHVRLDSMVELDRGGMHTMGPPRVTAFKGEGEFLAALQSVTEEEPPRVYFLTGHGERDPEDFDPQTGYSTVAAYIKRDNLAVAKWNLLARQELPADAELIISAGPRTTFMKAERALLDAYLRRGGRLMILLDPHRETHLESFLAAWGVQVDDTLLMARGGSLFGTELIMVEAVGAEYAPHPITARLTGVNTSFPYTRSIRRAERPPGSGPDGPQVTELVKAPEAFWGETDRRTDRAAFDPSADLRGPLSMAVAVETGAPPGVDLEAGLSRLVVIGTAGFVENSTITAVSGNVDFMMNAVNWLLQREQLIAVAPKQPQEFSLSMTPAQVTRVYYLTIGGLPFVVALSGIVVWLRRRK